MKIIQEYTMKEEQEIQISLLKYFDDICKREKLNYFLAYGTLLGAVRESGFISWDDDIDLWMLREDYEKFRAVCHKYSRNDIFFQDYKTDPYTPVPDMFRICVNGTFKWRKCCENAKFHTGIYFDIFPLDFYKCSPESEKEMKTINFYHDVASKNTSVHKPKTLKGKIYYILTKIYPQKRARRKLLEIIEKECEPSSTLVCYATSFIYPKNIYHYEDFKKSTQFKFETMTCPCPIGYERVLTERYGKWQLPSKTKPEHIKAYKVQIK